MSWWGWWGRNDADLRDEIREHIEIETRENIERGMAPEDARRAAERAFGNAGVTREWVREAKPLYWLDTFVQDARYGIRHLRRNPLLALATILTLTVGIGLNAGAFAVIEASMFRARVVGDADRYLRVFPQTWNKDGRLVEESRTTYDDYSAFRNGIAPLADLAAYGNVSLTPDTGDVPSIGGTLASCNFFPVLGLQQAQLGRLLQEDDCLPRPAAVAVLSDEVWQSRFGADPKIVGAVIHMNRQTLTVVGVAPAQIWDPVIFVPYTLQPRLAERDLVRESGAAWLQLAGRLKPGASRAAVQSELSVLAGQQDKLQPGRRTVVLVTNGSQVEDPGLPAGLIWGVYLMLGAPSLVLLTACANVSTLLLSRAAARRREIAVRFSLGASRARLMRMMVTEVLVLASAAGALSVWLSYYAPEMLLKVMGMRASYSLAPDWRVFAYLGGAALMAGCLSGLAPAIESLKVDLVSSMKGQEGWSGGSLGGWRASDTLVASQVALSLVLLSSAGLIARGYYKIFADDPGFDARRIMSSSVRSKTARYTPESAEAFWNTILARTRALPGVESVATASSGRGGHSERILLPGQSKEARRPATVNTVSFEYFRTLGIPLLGGRSFTAAEAEQPQQSVVVVSARLAQSLWPGQNPVGKLIRDSEGRDLEVVGVAGDTKSGMFYDNDFQLYKLRGRKDMDDVLLVRFSGNADSLALALRKLIREADPQIVPSPHTLQSEIDFSTDHLWRATKVVLFLAALPVLMSVIAIYGVSAFAVTQRTGELGIRIALGASHREVIRLVLVSGAKVILVGLVAGWVLAGGSSHILTHVFEHMGISMATRDPMIRLAAAISLALIAAIAMMGPARRASAVDPVKALRHE